MKALNNLKTGTKLIGAFVIVALITGVVAVIGFFNMQTINNNMSSLYTDRTVPIGILGKVDAGMMQIRGNVYKVLLIPAEAEASKTDITKLIADIDSKISQYKTFHLHLRP